jgi:ABC-type polar amino acid transport system ATPase subunit
MCHNPALGKTTTVRILTTLLRPDAGHARVAGLDVVRDAHRLRAHIGVSGQYAAVDDHLTGAENLEMVGRLHHLGAERSRLRARELLERFDLADAADRPVQGYSGGIRRRRDLAGALVADPPVLFLDEPTTGLDPDIGEQQHERFPDPALIQLTLIPAAPRRLPLMDTTRGTATDHRRSSVPKISSAVVAWTARSSQPSITSTSVQAMTRS